MAERDFDIDAVPVSVPAMTRSGNEIDMANLPGKVRIELLERGELQLNQMLIPANMPGKKLKEYKERHKARMEQERAAAAKAAKKAGVPEAKPKLQLRVGDIITYKDKNYSILGLDPVEGRVKFKKLNTKGEEVLVSVPFDKVTKA